MNRFKNGCAQLQPFLASAPWRNCHSCHSANLRRRARCPGLLVLIRMVTRVCDRARGSVGSPLVCCGFLPRSDRRLRRGARVPRRDAAPVIAFILAGARWKVPEAVKMSLALVVLDVISRRGPPISGASRAPDMGPGGRFLARHLGPAMAEQHG
jgi:hypothetical protein